VQISVIASGSNGNCCLVEDKGTSILIDAGKSGKQIQRRMENLGKDLEKIDVILLTHAHHDHIAGAGVLSRRYNIPLYMTNQVYSQAKVKLGKIERKSFTMNGCFKVKNLKINPVITSHNVSSCGFVIDKFGFFTDTGTVTSEMKKIIPKLNGILLESNHDVEMVKNGHYPYFLKQWILSHEGHLSNEHASSLIQGQGKNLSLALLGHLSGNNNTRKAVKNTFESIVKRKMDFHICSRDDASGSWKL